MKLAFKHILIGFLLIVTFISFSQCAIMEKKNRRITNYFDDHLTPESDAGKVVLAPIAIPTGTIFLLSDALIIQPIVAIPKSLEDTSKYIWQNPSGGVLVQSFLLIPKLVITPVTFTVIWIRYALFY